MSDFGVANWRTTSSAQTNNISAGAVAKVVHVTTGPAKASVSDAKETHPRAGT